MIFNVVDTRYRFDSLSKDRENPKIQYIDLQGCIHSNLAAADYRDPSAFHDVVEESDENTCLGLPHGALACGEEWGGCFRPSRPHQPEPGKPRPAARFGNC
ncbi:hypothetical protein, partial [Nodularia spumigena]|uniref:hypothetical protein n=1 Tax=Nodularia spumigena TaxID=70799 RepID=UPI002B20DDC9